MLEHRAEHLENLACSVDHGLQADAETPKFGGPGQKNVVTYTPMTLTFLQQPFLGDFKKFKNTPPLRNNIFQKNG